MKLLNKDTKTDMLSSLDMPSVQLHVLAGYNKLEFETILGEFVYTFNKIL